MSRVFGLIGYPLSHSFSPRYFTEKFYREGISDCAYLLFELEKIEAFPGLMATQAELAGLNVTIPHKRSIMPYLDELDPAAAAIGAVNTIEFTDAGLRGHNTDWIGFRDALLHALNGLDGVDQTGIEALILGTGGSSRAVRYALDQMGIVHRSVTRTLTAESVADFCYADLTPEHIAAHRLIVNTTPLGMHPKVSAFPDIPYVGIAPGHLLFDLVYNPPKTIFMIKGEQQGARAINGARMLEGQAEAAWSIWNRENPSERFVGGA
jgi:shikimate dehydrogenase